MDSFFLILRRATATVNRIGLTIMLPLMGLMTTVAVFMRYVVHRPIVGADEMTGLLLLIVFFLSLAHCWVEGGHIRSEILISRLSPRLQRIADVWSLAVVLAFTGVLIYAFSKQTIAYFNYQKVTVDAEIVLWPFVALATLGSLLLGAAVLASLISLLSQQKQERSEEK
ncbi:MAG: TRAP transporter small permease [Betaproteobacteria bacterium]|nr:TRAP transporter small permease [Betaproteobacteria bacterium]